MGRSIVLLIVLGALVTKAVATVNELEPNDSIVTAQGLPTFASTCGEGVLGSLSAGDVDFYQIEIASGVLFSANVFDFTPLLPDDNDPILGLFDSGGTLIAFDDDGGPGTLAAIFVGIPSGGTYFVGVSGVGDTGFVGNHAQDFSYMLVLNMTPAPGAIPLLAGYCLRVSRRRTA
jgi:hypothetical protein